jgi:hypothetical protein
MKQRKDKTPVHMTFEQPLLERVEDWRRKQPVIPPRAEALRELVQRGLLHDGPIEDQAIA